MPHLHPPLRFATIPSRTIPLRLRVRTATTVSSSKMSGPIFFWREFEHPYGFLSQWFALPFTVSDTTYATTEMWMMIQKARLFHDTESEKAMLETTDPKTHRDLGRKVKGYDGKVWDQRGCFHTT